MKNLNISFSSNWLGSAESRLRRILLVFLFTLVPMLASADEYEIEYRVLIDNIYYNLYSFSWGLRRAEVTDGHTEYSGSIVIPESVTYNGESYKVLAIGAYAFMGCSSLTSVMIPNSVTSIGYMAFDGCTTLPAVDIPNSVTSIESGAFWGCDGLTSVTIPNSVETIGDDAFENCSNLTSIDIPNSVTNIGEGAFRFCTSLRTVAISNSVTSIGNNVFSGCSSLTSVTIPNSVTSIGEGAFSHCGLISVDIPNSVTSIGEGAFYCESLTSVTIPNSVTSIGGWAFGGWSLKEIHSYMEEPCSIDENVFGWDAYNNAILIVPHGTTDKYKSMDYWSNFRSVCISGGEELCYFETYEDGTASVIGFSNYWDTDIWLNIPEKITLDGIEYSVTSIGENAFQDASSLSSVIIPNSVSSIGKSAFIRCKNLTYIDIPNTVTSIGEEAFGYCFNLTSVDIPNSVTSIGAETFVNCFDLTSVTIPNSVTSIGSSAFSGCSSLTSVEIPNSVTSIGSSAFSGCSSLTSFSIPNSVTSLEPSTFSRCSSLTSITIPNSVTIIGKYAFYLCSSVTSVTIPNSVTSIGDEAFEYCSKIDSVSIPNGVTSVGNGAFRNCTGLISVDIPNSVKSIGKEAFKGCTYLKKIMSYILEPFAIDEYVFYTNYAWGPKDRILYVPKGTVELYKKTAGWNKMKNIIEIEVVSDAEWTSLLTLYEQIAENNIGWAQKWQNVITAGKITEVRSLDGLTIEDEHVVGIDLSNQKLAGQFPSILLTFPNVKKISLNGNHFDGDIQTIIEELSLYVTNNDPSFVSELQSLDLSGNNLTGNIGALAYSTETTPSILSRFPSLKTLKASNNKFEDIYPALPASITNLDISNQKMDRVVELNMSDLSLEDFSSKVPTILLYDKVNRTYKNSINLLCTKADLATFNKYNTKEWAMQLQIDDNQLSIPYVSTQKEYHGESGDTLNVLNMTGNDVTDGSSFRIALSFNQGDANFINGVDATDLQTTILYAFGGYRNYPFNFTAADTYKDGIINVQDVICTVNILLDSHNEQAVEARSKKVNMADMEAKPDTDAYLYVKDGKVFLHSRVPVASLSIKADGNVKWNIERLGLSQSTANGNVVAYSLNGTTIPSYEDVVLGECTHAKLYSVSLSDTNAQPISVNFGNSATSIINTSNATNGDMKIYNVSGYRLNKMRKGINIIRSNGTTKKIYK